MLYGGIRRQGLHVITEHCVFGNKVAYTSGLRICCGDDVHLRLYIYIYIYIYTSAHLGAVCQRWGGYVSEDLCLFMVTSLASIVW